MTDSPSVCVLAATERGRRVLERLLELAPNVRLTVFCFKEEDDEPPFYDNIKSLVLNVQGCFYTAKNVGLPRYEHVWEEIGAVDVLLCVSWRFMVPEQIYKQARIGSFVFHDSLLPAYRGFAPTVWSIVNGETKTGASLITMSSEVDAGDIISQKSVTIKPTDTIKEVMTAVTDTYIHILEQNLSSLLQNSFNRRPQVHAHATYTVKRVREDYLIDWTKSALECYNLVRASTTPYPGAFSYLDGKEHKILAADLRETHRLIVDSPGRVYRCTTLAGCAGVSICCGDRKCLFVQKVEVDGRILEDKQLAALFKLSSTYKSSPH